MNEWLLVGLILVGILYLLQLGMVLEGLLNDMFDKKREFFYWSIPFLPVIVTIIQKIRSL